MSESIKSGQRYKFTNEENGLILDISGANHRNILGWDVHGNDNQQWITERQDDGQWTIRSVWPQKYLGFETTPEDGTPLVGLDEPQLWDIEVLSDSEDHDNPRVNRLWVRGTLLVVEFPIGKSDPRPIESDRQLQLLAARDGKNQVWVLEEYL
ncbi:ricin B lectin domain-containing protein [Lactarius pseudohatsudake]|nr:ricin B lectin domain-containing protein [Lactarius pseudohatsudake]